MIMGTQFWWFFDVAAVAILLVTIYLAGRKGFAKTIVVMLGYVLSMILAVSASGTLSETVYNNSVKQSNIKNIKKALDDNDLIEKTKYYIEGLGYSVTLDDEITTDILAKGGDVSESLYEYICNINGRQPDTQEGFREKLADGYADMMNSILKDKITDYELEIATEKIRKDIASFGDFLALYLGEDNQLAAEYIEENYTAGCASDIIKIFCFIIIVFVLMTIVRVIAGKLNDKEMLSPLGDIADHAVGGVLGIFEGAAVIVILTAVVRVLVIMGSNEMMLFNSEAINKTILFKHIYNLVMKL